MSTESSSENPVWATGTEQVEVEVVVTGENYKVDSDIAKRMKLVQEGIEHETPILLTGCSARDFERALTFCANDREEKEPPSPELLQIIKEMGPSDDNSETAEPTTRITRGIANLAVTDDQDDDDDEEEDETYEPSSTSEASDSGDEYSDTDLADSGTAAIRAELAEFREKEKEKEKEKQEQPAE